MFLLYDVVCNNPSSSGSSNNYGNKKNGDTVKSTEAKTKVKGKGKRKRKEPPTPKPVKGLSNKKSKKEQSGDKHDTSSEKSSNMNI